MALIKADKRGFSLSGLYAIFSIVKPNAAAYIIESRIENTRTRLNGHAHWKRKNPP